MWSITGGSDHALERGSILGPGGLVGVSREPGASPREQASKKLLREALGSVKAPENETRIDELRTPAHETAPRRGPLPPTMTG